MTKSNDSLARCFVFVLPLKAKHQKSKRIQEYKLTKQLVAVSPNCHFACHITSQPLGHQEVGVKLLLHKTSGGRKKTCLHQSNN